MINRKTLVLIGLVITAVFLASCVRPTDRVDNPNVTDDPLLTDETPLDPVLDENDETGDAIPDATVEPSEEPGGDTDGGDTDGGDTDGGDTDGGDTDGGDTDGGDTDGGDTDGGDTDGGDTDGGDTDGGDTDGGDTDGGDTDGGDTDGGDTDGGDTDGGDTSPTIPDEHVVAAGENLYRIGLKYGISFLQIAQENNIAPPYTIFVGQRLDLPNGDSGNGNGGDGGEETTYVVQRGDTLYKIGQRFGISWVQIAEANGLSNPNYIAPGETLKIPVNTPGPSPQFTHTVRQGETLYSISVVYGVPWTAVAAENNISSPYIIFPGTTLRIPGSD